MPRNGLKTKPVAPVEVSAVDRVARKTLAQHVKDCAAQGREVKEAIKGLYRRLWWLVGLLILGQGAAIKFLADRLPH